MNSMRQYIDLVGQSKKTLRESTILTSETGRVYGFVTAQSILTESAYQSYTPTFQKTIDHIDREILPTLIEHAAVGASRKEALKIISEARAAGIQIDEGFLDDIKSGVATARKTIKSAGKKIASNAKELKGMISKSIEDSQVRQTLMKLIKEIAKKSKKGALEVISRFVSMYGKLKEFAANMAQLQKETATESRHSMRGHMNALVEYSLPGNADDEELTIDEPKVDPREEAKKALNALAGVALKDRAKKTFDGEKVYKWLAKEYGEDKVAAFYKDQGWDRRLSFKGTGHGDNAGAVSSIQKFAKQLADAKKAKDENLANTVARDLVKFAQDRGDAKVERMVRELLKKHGMDQSKFQSKNGSAQKDDLKARLKAKHGNKLAAKKATEKATEAFCNELGQMLREYHRSIKTMILEGKGTIVEYDMNINDVRAALKYLHGVDSADANNSADRETSGVGADAAAGANDASPEEQDEAAQGLLKKLPDQAKQLGKKLIAWLDEHPKSRMLIFAGLTFAAGMTGLPSAGMLVGAVLRFTYAIAQGKGVKESFKRALIGALFGYAIGTIGTGFADWGVEAWDNVFGGAEVPEIPSNMESYIGGRSYEGGVGIDSSDAEIDVPTNDTGEIGDAQNQFNNGAEMDVDDVSATEDWLVKLDQDIVTEVPEGTEVPVAPTVSNEIVPEAPEVSSYKVSQGNTLSDIAQSHGVSLKDLLDANDISYEDANSISIGQEIEIPSTKIDPGTNIYDDIAPADMETMLMKPGAEIEASDPAELIGRAGR